MPDDTDDDKMDLRSYTNPRATNAARERKAGLAPPPTPTAPQAASSGVMSQAQFSGYTTPAENAKRMKALQDKLRATGRLAPSASQQDQDSGSQGYQ